MPTKARKILLASIMVVFAGLVALLILRSSRGTRGSALPNPNGYDDFLAAHAKITGIVGLFAANSYDELRVLVSTNAEALQLLRMGLSRKCAFPLAVAMTNYIVVVNDLPKIKSLAQLLAAEGRLAELEKRPGDAARSYVDCIRLGNKSSRGGFLINRLVGVACEAIGCTALARVTPSLSCEQARPIITQLQELDASAVTWQEVMRNENVFARHEIWAGPNPIMWVNRLVSHWIFGRKARERGELRHYITLAHVRLLTIELALRCYNSQKGRAPAQLNDLVPTFLSQIPVDPFSGQPPIYVPQGTNWLLYSIGMDRIDNGGKPVGRGPESKGDIFFDSPW